MTPPPARATFYVTLEVQVEALSEDMAKVRATNVVAAAPHIVGFIIGDVEKGADLA